MREASFLELSGSVHGYPWSKHTAQHLALMSNLSHILSHVPTSLPGEVSCLASLCYTAPCSSWLHSLLCSTLPQPTLPVSHLPQAMPCSEDPVIHLFPAHICPPGPIFPPHSPKTVIKEATYQLYPTCHTNALC